MVLITVLLNLDRDIAGVRYRFDSWICGLRRVFQEGDDNLIPRGQERRLPPEVCIASCLLSHRVKPKIRTIWT